MIGLELSYCLVHLLIGNEMGNYRTEQEDFWAGDFGKEYIERNQGEELLASNLAFFSRTLERTRNVGSAIEFGANIGMNLKALQLLLPKASLSAIEINPQAAEKLEGILPKNNVIKSSILDFSPHKAWDLVLIKGVLIHVNPAELPVIYKSLVESSSRYLLVAEYYNPEPVSVPYRGHSDRLFKRDFAGEILDAYPEMELIDYGFAYHRDPVFPQGDITWFLIEKV
jgi:pseudaminic acid biosynthesis-associated methylase